MKVSTFTTVVAFTGLAAAQISKIPACALSCFETAISKTDCGLNTYCQCTSGANVIQSSVIECLCKSNACSASELAQLQSASNNACSSALAASSKTYSAATIPANACATGGAGSSNGTSTGSQTTGAGAAGAAGASSPAGSSSSGNPAPTSGPMLGYECAALGLAGMALLI